MHRHLIAAAFLVPAAGLLAINAGLFSSSVPAAAQGTPVVSMAAARPCDDHCGAWMDSHLRLNQLQLIGTADSAKLKPDGAVMGLIRMGGKDGAQALDYGEPPLAEQLDQDVRSLAFDVAYDPQGGAYKSPAGASMAMDLLPDAYVAAMKKPGFKVIHVFDVDYRSSCLALADCLKQVADWSRAHPHHLPIVISLRPNDGKTPMPGATAPTPCDEAALMALDGEVRAAFTPDQLFTPTQMQGTHASLRAAALEHAWPRLGEVRGKVIVVLEADAAKAAAYHGQALFVATDEASPQAAFLAIPDPVKDQARIAAAVKAGFMVITRADADTREARRNDVRRRDAAFASGAQVVQTDFAAADAAIGRYRVSLADDPGAMCGPALAPEHCTKFEAPKPASLAALP